jgi:hypothetical protein
MRQVCKNCKTLFEVAPVPGVLEQIRRHQERWLYDSTEVLFVACPHCGTRQLASQRRFFWGLLSAMAFWNLLRAVPLVILLILMAVLFSTWQK